MYLCILLHQCLRVFLRSSSKDKLVKTYNTSDLTIIYSSKVRTNHVEYLQVHCAGKFKLLIYYFPGSESVGTHESTQEITVDALDCVDNDGQRQIPSHEFSDCIDNGQCQDPNIENVAVCNISKGSLVETIFSPEGLTTLLNQSLIGKAILDRAKSGPLSETSQNELSGILAEHHINSGRRTTEECLNVYTDSIICLLKYEIKVNLINF